MRSDFKEKQEKYYFSLRLISSADDVESEMSTEKKCGITDIEVSFLMNMYFEHNSSSEVTRPCQEL